MNSLVSQLADDVLYSTTESSKYLGVTPGTLKQSRWSGTLGGVAAPPFIRIGSSVRYKGSTLREWREQFPEIVPHNAIGA